MAVIRTPTLPTATLKALRKIGDPELKPTGVRRAALPLSPPKATSKLDGVWPPALITKVSSKKIVLQPERLEEAQWLFATYGTEIGGALLLAALPQSYATAWGSKVLWANAQLEHDLVRRIKGTAQFVLFVTQRGSGDQRDLWDPSVPPDISRPKPPWQWCVELRLYHQAIREHLDGERSRLGPILTDDNKPPLNQEDLLAMLLSFSITTFEVLERYGISWTADQQESYLHMWDVIGAFMGIGVPSVKQALKDAKHPLPGDRKWVGLRPTGVDVTRGLLDQLRARQWQDPGPFRNDAGPDVLAGRVLTKALLDEFCRAMPRSTQRLPLAVMRALAPEVVRSRLNLGGGGLLMRALEQLPRRRFPTGRFTETTAPNPKGARVMRALGNEVSARVIMRFLNDNDDFEIPGLASGLPRSPT